jgi:hypothetical protein
MLPQAAPGVLWPRILAPLEHTVLAAAAGTELAEPDLEPKAVLAALA